MAALFMFRCYHTHYMQPSQWKRSVLGTSMGLASYPLDNSAVRGVVWLATGTFRSSTPSASAGAHEPPKAVKEHVTPVPCKYKLFRKLT